MKNSLLILLFITYTSRAQLLFQLNNDKLICYTYSDGDEFNQNKVDEQRWNVGLGWTRVLMSQDLAFSPKNVVFENGLVKFIAKKEDSTYVLFPWEIDSGFVKRKKLNMIDNKFQTRYSAGCIITKQKYHYGLYELKFKVEEGCGIWPAFWFFGGNKNEEIDAFELKCERNNEIHVDTHCPYGCDRGYKNKLGFNTNYGGWMPVSAYLHEGYNTMLLEWAKGEIRWFINGYPLAYFKGDLPNPMNLYLNTSVAKDGEAFKPGPDKSTVWPNTYSVDYFRAWKLLDTTSETILKENKNIVLSTPYETNKAALPTKNRGLMYNKKQFNIQQGMITVNFSNNKLTMVVYGKLKEQQPKITLKSLNSGKTWAADNIKETWKIDINPNIDYELELTISENKKHYTQKIKLSK